MSDDQARESYRAKIDALRQEIDARHQQINELVKEAVPDFHFLNYETSLFWHCDDSPTGWCLFILDDNCQKTYCRYCSGPVERSGCADDCAVRLEGARRMKLDRNINPNGMGKYALINLRTNKIEWGNTPEDEFFVIKLKDKYASAALDAYAKSCLKDDPEFAKEVHELASKAMFHPLKKKPD